MEKLVRGSMEGLARGSARGLMGASMEKWNKNGTYWQSSGQQRKV